MVGTKFIPQAINVDLHESLMPPNLARFIKNLNYELGDTSNASDTNGGQTGVFKSLQSNARYAMALTLPDGFNHPIGHYTHGETKETYVFVYNDKGNHTVYRINGLSQTFDIVYQGAELEFVNQPENYIHQGACFLTMTFVQDPVFGNKKRRSFLEFTDGRSRQHSICVEDSIATKSFNDTLFPNLRWNFDKREYISMGVPTPQQCITIYEKPIENDVKTNRLLFNTWQFRLMYVDVWGRPSEHGIISDMYIPGGGNCNPSAKNIASCLELEFAAPPPYIDRIQVEYRNCNDAQWYVSKTLELYLGSPLGDWWLRSRNPDVKYNSSSNIITHEFCADDECDPIPLSETSRTLNPQPTTSVGLTQVNKFIALSNNTEGMAPFSKSLRDKIKIVVDTPTADNPGNSEIRNIRVFVEIQNNFLGNQPIYRQGLDANGPLFYGFGAFPSPFRYRSFFGYQQYFKNPNQQGFVGYLAGTDAYTVSRQYLMDTTTGTFSEITNFTDGMGTYGRSSAAAQRIYYQVFEFTNVPKGQYIFRIASHQSDPAVDRDYQRTSTTVSGQSSFKYGVGRDYGKPLLINNQKEIIIDVCEKSYDSKDDNKILLIDDLVGSQQTTVEQGYVYNTDELDEKRYGVPLLRVSVTNRSATAEGYYTDHNGFYFIAAPVNNVLDNRFRYKIFGFCNCQYTELVNERSGTEQKLYTVNHYLNKSSCRDYSAQKCNYTQVKGTVKDCDTGVGIPNVGVVVTQGPSTMTDENGNYTLIVHDDTTDIFRKGAVYFMTNSCGFVDCSDGCIKPAPISLPRCSTCVERIYNVPVTKVRYVEINRGLLSGGTYPMGVQAWDWLGRGGFVQPLGNVTMPTFQQTKIFAPSTLHAEIDPTAYFGPEVKRITFWIGEETTIETYITWIVDSVQFIDNTGDVNEISPTQIKIYYSSLIEFSKQNSFNTTVNWGFISLEDNMPVVADKVEFLINGNGEFFPTPVISLVKYDKDGKYILVNYTDELKSLRTNALIRLVRPKVCTGLEPSYELCTTTEIVNGYAVANKIALPAFDTYYQKRQIPVPFLATPGDPNADPPTTDVFANELRILGFPFEHKSPSDFWGKNCWNVGRVNIKNPYEAVRYHRDYVALSGALSETGFLNYRNYFDDAKKVSFETNGLNGIVSLLAGTGRVFIIGQSDYCIVGFNDNLARVNSQGVVQVASAENTFGPPQPKIEKYGCLLFDKNTISHTDGLVHFLDSTKSILVQHDYQVPFPLSKNGADSLIKTKVKSVQLYNVSHTDKRYFTGIANTAGNEYLLTDFVIKSRNYVNNLRKFNPAVSETLAFGTRSKVFKATYSFTPEMYAVIEGELDGTQLFSFKDGLPFSHYDISGPKSYNTFYGVKCERVVRFIVVVDNVKKKKFSSAAVYCKQSKYFIDQAVTEGLQTTRVLKDHWKSADYGWYAPILCDINTLMDVNRPEVTPSNSVLDGDTMVGLFLDVRFVGDPVMNDKYSELQAFVVNVFASEKSGT